jgi:hypothetical protein
MNERPKKVIDADSLAEEYITQVLQRRNDLLHFTEPKKWFNCTDARRAVCSVDDFLDSFITKSDIVITEISTIVDAYLFMVEKKVPDALEFVDTRLRPFFDLWKKDKE